MPSVLWCCWLGGRKSIRPVKTEWWGAGVVICLEQDADLHMAQLMPLPFTVSCFSKIQIGFTFLVPAHLGSPGKRAVKRVCVCYFSKNFFVDLLLLLFKYFTTVLWTSLLMLMIIDADADLCCSSPQHSVIHSVWRSSHCTQRCLSRRISADPGKFAIAFENI